MKALEFKSRVIDNQIQIPEKIQSELSPNEDKEIRVIVLIADSDKNVTFQATAQQQFLQGYADSDSIYDNELG